MFKSFAFAASPVVFTFLLQCTLLSTAESNECIELNVGKTRVFNSLAELQGNKLAFDPRKSSYQGNYVAFAEKNVIDTLYKNSFFIFDSPNIHKISLDNHQIRVIEDGAFISLSCVAVLNLQKNRIETISNGVFNELRALHELDLGENNIKDVPERTFISNVRLRKLNLTRNSINALHPDSFFKLSMLEELDLSNNQLRRILPETLQYFGRLRNLQLGSNEIERLDAEKWTNLSNLTVLNLSDNALESFDTSYEFSFSSSLFELYLNENYLTHLNPLALRKHLPLLKSIDICDNPWPCPDLHSILRTFNDSSISYHSNSASDPNVGGIACNKSLETYKKAKRFEITTPTTTSTSSTHPPQTYFFNEAPGNSLYLTNTKILESLKTLQTIVVCLFIIIVIFIFMDVAVRSGCLNNVFRRQRNAGTLDQSDAENFSLLTERY